MTPFRERVAWFRRMPRHWRLLLASQAAFLTFAVSYRRRVVAEVREEAEQDRLTAARARELRALRDRSSPSSS